MKTIYTFDRMEKMRSENPSKIIEELGFEETIRLACAMLINERWKEELQEFAVSLLQDLRKKYANKWNSSWRFDALLGFANDIIMDYDERYEAFKRAIEKANPAPPELLIAYAKCNSSPGIPPVTEEEAIALIKKAMKDKLYVEGVMFLRGIYWSMKNKKEELFWSNVLDKIKDNGAKLPRLDKIPNITDDC